MPARPARGLVSEVGNHAVVRRSSLDYIYFGTEQYHEVSYDMGGAQCQWRPAAGVFRAHTPVDLLVGEVGTCPALIVSVFYECDSSNDSKTVHTSEYVYTYSFRYLTAYLLGLARPDARDSSEGYEVGDPVESRYKSYSGGWHPGVISEVHRPKRRRGGAAGGRAAGPRYTVKYTIDGTSETDVPPGRLRHAVCLSSIMPAAVIEYMRRNPRSVVLTNHATAADLESVLPVVGMLALAADDLVPDAASERPRAAGCTYEILGTLEFEFEKGCPSRPVSFKQYQRGAPLASLLPERIDTPNGVKKLIDLMPAPIVPSPASSDRSRAPTLPPLPLAPGPVLQGASYCGPASC